MTDVRPFSPVPMDLALVSRLAKSQFIMDTVTALTRATNPLESALLAAVPLADLGFPTLIVRDEDHGFLGQIRHRTGERYAQIVSLAPEPDEMDDEALWLTLLDALIETAARRGAHLLRAEVTENRYTIIRLLRRVGFSVYTRQTVFRYQPGQPLYPIPPRRVILRSATEQDTNRILALIGNLVPSLVQQAVAGGDRENLSGLVVEQTDDKRLIGYLDVVEGKTGLFIKPFLHPDIFEDEATRIFAEALRSLPKAERLPVYFSILSFQEWLGVPLAQLGLTEGPRQAIFVKHVVARIRQTDEVVQAAREVIFGSLVNAIEFGVDKDTHTIP
jgi:hypothetical protein